MKHIADNNEKIKAVTVALVIVLKKDIFFSRQMPTTVPITAKAKAGIKEVVASLERMNSVVADMTGAVRSTAGYFEVENTVAKNIDAANMKKKER